MNRLPILLVATLFAASLLACGDDGGTSIVDDDTGSDTATTGDDDELAVPTTYAFDDTVAYSGQTFRHVLIKELNAWVGGLGASIDAGSWLPGTEGQVVAVLDSWFRFDSDISGGEPLTIQTDPDLLQINYDAISSGKDLVGKLAGNDDATDHKVWTTEFRGWEDPSIAAHGGDVTSPELFVTALFETIEANALNRSNGNLRVGPSGDTLPLHVTENGLDLQQLTEKFLLMAITFSQGTDDYLDDDIADKGLLAPNTLKEGKSYTELAHAWDEGFGYFGAARDYADYTDDEIAGKGGRDGWSSGYHDTDDDGAIDLESEYNFGASKNAAKRDRGSSDLAPTDYTTQVFDAFLTGRAIIHAAGEALTEEELDALKAQRDIAVDGWEKAIAATVVHYVNDTIQATLAIGTEDYSFTGHAKVFSEMKGFALGLQFNPRSPMAADFEALHALMGDGPVLGTADQADIDAYVTDLLTARDLLADAYGFDDANMGDDDGANGW